MLLPATVQCFIIDSSHDQIRLLLSRVNQNSHFRRLGPPIFLKIQTLMSVLSLMGEKKWGGTSKPWFRPTRNVKTRIPRINHTILVTKNYKKSKTRKSILHHRLYDEQSLGNRPVCAPGQVEVRLLSEILFPTEFISLPVPP